MTSAHALLPLLVAVGCSTQPPGPRQKPGVDEQTQARDTASCRSTAQAEVLRRYPSSGGPAGLGAARFDDCMLEKGYRRP